MSGQRMTRDSKIATHHIQEWRAKGEMCVHLCERHIGPSRDDSMPPRAPLCGPPGSRNLNITQHRAYQK